MRPAVKLPNKKRARIMAEVKAKAAAKMAAKGSAQTGGETSIAAPPHHTAASFADFRHRFVCGSGRAPPRRRSAGCHGSGFSRAHESRRLDRFACRRS
jgi:hypothetical protein